MSGLKTLFISALNVLIASSACEDPEEDAAYIAEATTSEAYIEAVIGSLAELMASSIMGESAKSGHYVSEAAADALEHMRLPI